VPVIITLRRHNMKNPIVGREQELSILERIAGSNHAEFIAVYGRRRIGKTFLIREFFSREVSPSPEHQLFFSHSGVQDGSSATELARFQLAIETQLFNGLRLPAVKTFHAAFELLINAIEARLYSDAGIKRAVIFLDELPWIAKPRSGVLAALDSAWNSTLSRIPKVKLIVCGSAASWMINNLVKATGGLHNRLTCVLPLSPFTLLETKQFLESKALKLNLSSIIELYLAVGGVPHYLMQTERGRTVDANIAAICFDRSGFLREEFNQLFRSLFTNFSECEKIVRLLHAAPKGLTLDAIAKIGRMSKGGRLRQRLRELEEAGFVGEFVSLDRKSKNSWFRLVDEYCSFFLKWIEPAPKSVFNGDGLPYWQSKRDTPSYFSWAGNAFETLCLKHAREIRASLALNPAATTSTWRYVPKQKIEKGARGKAKNAAEKGAQIDLLFDGPRDIALCEIKYSAKPYVVDKKFTSEFLNRTETFKEKTKTKKEILKVLICNHGVKPSPWVLEAADKVIDEKALFKAL